MRAEAARTTDAAPPPRTPPGPSGTPFLGNVTELERAPIEFLTRIHHEYGDVVRLRAFRIPMTLLVHPDHVQHVLQTRHTAYDKETWDFRMLRPVLGESLLTIDGAPWLRRRRLMQPAFHRDRIHGFARTMTDAAERTHERWEAAAQAGAPIDVAAEMSRLALDVVTPCLFGTDVDFDAAAVNAAVGAVSAAFIKGMRSPLTLLALWLGRPLGPTRRPTAVLDRIVNGIIAARRRSAADRDDLLGILMAARDEETGAPLSDRELRNEVLTLFTAGHETTANALSWTWFLLARHPEVERRLHAHLAEVLGGRPPRPDDVPALDYVRMVLDEAMRLYPPAWATSRNPIADDVIGGFAVPAQSLVLLSPYLTHRHPAFWPDPEAFDPERFRPARARAQHRFAYFPFGGGPHRCIGESFALLEATLVLASLAQRWTASIPPERVVTPEPLVTLRPRGLAMTLARQPGVA
jgi:cytochrome P450